VWCRYAPLALAAGDMLQLICCTSNASCMHCCAPDPCCAVVNGLMAWHFGASRFCTTSPPCYPHFPCCPLPVSSSPHSYACHPDYLLAGAGSEAEPHHPQRLPWLPVHPGSGQWRRGLNPRRPRPCILGPICPWPGLPLPFRFRRHAPLQCADKLPGLQKKYRA